MAFGIKEHNEAKFQALIASGIGYMSFHNAVGGRRHYAPVSVNLFSKDTEINDMNGYAIIWYGTGDKTAWQVSKRKKSVRVDGVEYSKLKGFLDYFQIEPLITT
jgi:hypothetical protein